MLFFAAIQG